MCSITEPNRGDIMPRTYAFQEVLLRGGRYRVDFDALFQVAPIGLAILDEHLRFVRCNDRLAEINGIPVDDHIRRTVGELLPGIAPEVEEAFLLVFSTGRPSDELRVVGNTPRAPGRTCWFLENARPLVDEEGTVRHILVSVQEVTALEEMRRSLKQSESTFRASQQLSPDGFAILRAVRDRSGQVMDLECEYANPAAEAAVRTQPLTGRKLRQILASQDGGEARFRWYADVLRGRRVEERELEYRSEDGSAWVRASCIAVDSERIAVGFHDTSETRRVEERLRLVTREYRHRLKNLIAVASALVFQGAKNATDVESFSAALVQRLSAMAAAQDILGDEDSDAVTLSTIISSLASIINIHVGAEVTSSCPLSGGANMALNGHFWVGFSHSTQFNGNDRDWDISAGPLWMAPALQEVIDDGVGRVQSSVRPVGAVEMTAGPDGVRELGPILLIRL
jgi:PAS domain S-box-containing protein